MKCVKCGTRNITKADYCKKCGYKFSKKEQNEARRKTIIGKIELLETIYNTCTLKVITDHIIFKIGSLIVILAIGVYFWICNGLDLKLLDGDNYEISYNKTENEYYLLTKDSKIFLNLYVPNRTKEIMIIHYDVNNNKIDEKKYKATEKIILETKEKEYYILNANYVHNDDKNLKLYVLQT